MILFWTRSLRYSTDVPWPSGGLCAPAKLDPTLSECIDWASQSRTVGAVVVGVAADANERVAESWTGARFNGGGTGEGEEEGGAVLKAERRFCAEDLRRIAGRCGSWGKCDIIVITVVVLHGDDEMAGSRGHLVPAFHFRRISLDQQQPWQTSTPSQSNLSTFITRHLRQIARSFRVSTYVRHLLPNRVSSDHLNSAITPCSLSRAAPSKELLPFPKSSR